MGTHALAAMPLSVPPVVFIVPNPPRLSVPDRHPGTTRGPIGAYRCAGTGQYNEPFLIGKGRSRALFPAMG